MLQNGDRTKDYNVMELAKKKKVISKFKFV